MPRRRPPCSRWAGPWCEALGRREVRCRRIRRGDRKIQGQEGGEVTTEYAQFAGAMILMVGMLIGSYWFVYVPNRGNPENDDDQQR